MLQSCLFSDLRHSELSSVKESCVRTGKRKGQEVFWRERTGDLSSVQHRCLGKAFLSVLVKGRIPSF